MSAEDVSATASTAGEASRRTLGITEIAEQIVESCPNATLVSLSRVDRSLSEMALNKIWRKQDGLDNLMRCLPSHFRISELSASFRGGAAALDDWVRFDSYAGRIHTLHIRKEQDQRGIAFLTEQYRGSSPFSQVRALYIFRRGLDETGRFDILSGHALKILWLRGSVADGETSLFSSLSYLPSTSPSLQSLTLWIDRRLGMNCLERLIGQLPGLRSLSLETGDNQDPDTDALSQRFVTILAAMVHLNAFSTSYPLRQFSGTGDRVGATSSAFTVSRTSRVAVRSHGGRLGLSPAGAIIVVISHSVLQLVVVDEFTNAAWLNRGSCHCAAGPISLRGCTGANRPDG